MRGAQNWRCSTRADVRTRLCSLSRAERRPSEEREKVELKQCQAVPTPRRALSGATQNRGSIRIFAFRSTTGSARPENRRSAPRARSADLSSPGPDSARGCQRDLRGTSDRIQSSIVLLCANVAENSLIVLLLSQGRCRRTASIRGWAWKVHILRTGVCVELSASTIRRVDAGHDRQLPPLYTVASWSKPPKRAHRLVQLSKHDA